MNSRIRRATGSLLALVTLALLCLASVSAAAVHFQHESYQAFQAQVAAGQVHAVTFNKKAHTVHVSLNDKRHVLASYPSRDEPQIAAALQAKGVSVKVAKHAPKAAASGHHTLRYVAAGLLLVVIAIVALVLGLNRRRPRTQEPQEPRGRESTGARAAGPPTSEEDPAPS